MRKANIGTLYKSKGIALYKTFIGSCHGLPLIMRSDDDEVVAEIHRRNLWPVFEPGIKRGQTCVLLVESPQGVDAFIWIGDPNDGGFCWWTLVGGIPGTQSCDAMVNSLQQLMTTITSAKVFEKVEVR